ncbi:redox-regulatory protein FAM213A [Biomphalaria glabrata]|nr:redox-regulatory protein FAM213A-like [Biomphalaria glabrata]
MFILNEISLWLEISFCGSMGAFTKLGLAGAVAVVGVGILCNLPVNPNNGFPVVAEKWCCDHGSQKTWMIIVQGGSSRAVLSEASA